MTHKNANLYLYRNGVNKVGVVPEKSNRQSRQHGVLGYTIKIKKRFSAVQATLTANIVLPSVAR